jgi:hypothetical protein
MAGLLPSITSIREPKVAEALPEAQTVHIDGTQPSPIKLTVVAQSDGGAVIKLNANEKNNQPLKEAKFNANLALHLDDTYLGQLADELLRGIEEDERSRQDWLDERAEGIKLLALKIEKPSTAGQGAGANESMASRSRNTLLLEACLRFQANASSELLPTGGPVKVEDKLSEDTMDGDELAQLLEDDFNYYLTRTASEYVPDTERMLLWVAAGGSGFKKVYRCPIRRRPVSESVDAADLCVSNAATDLANADRVTFTSRMRQSVMKRMQHLKIYRDVNISQPSNEPLNSVEAEKEEITGVRISNRHEDILHTIKECYCQIEVEGDEQKEKGEYTGLPRPYKVTIEKTSRQILEIRRNWRKDDEMERPREVFVKYPFVPGFGFYDIGLIQIAGNPTIAATALLRIMIDCGILGNFPGFLVAKGSDKQNTTDMVAFAGAGTPIDISMAPANGGIKDVVMPLPYKEAGPATFNLYQEIVKDAKGLAGTPDIAVGEGRQDAPVGTTIALIEQATKVTDAVHKRLHTAQSKEFELLRDLFKEYPEDFWRFNQERDQYWDAAKLTKALNDYNLVPRADPNTSSNVHRIMRAQAIYMMAKDNKAAFQQAAVYEYIMRTLGVQNPESMLQPPDQMGPAPDPKALAAAQTAQAQQLTAQARMTDAQTKAKTAQAEIATRALESRNDVAVEQLKVKADQSLHDKDRAADALSQVSQQHHERQITAMGIASDHALAAKEQKHETGLAVAQQTHEATQQANEPKAKEKP